MDLIDKLKAIADRAAHNPERLATEEATKNALVMPFINALGYNVFDPAEVVPEFTCPTQGNFSWRRRSIQAPVDRGRIRPSLTSESGPVGASRVRKAAPDWASAALAVRCASSSANPPQTHHLLRKSRGVTVKGSAADPVEL